MKKLNLIILLLVILISTSAWNWNTHQNIALKVYNDFQPQLQFKLNSTLIREGSIAPDKDFHDNVLHHYPPSYKKALYWMDILNNSLKAQDYENASYAFGVITHYLSDSFASPHAVAKEPYDLHAKFEKQPTNYISKTKCAQYNLNINETLYEYSQKGQQDWNNWLKTNSDSIPKNEVDSSIRLIYSFSLKTFNTTCAEKTQIIKAKYFITPRIILYFIILIILITSIIISIKKSS